MNAISVMRAREQRQRQAPSSAPDGGAGDAGHGLASVTASGSSSSSAANTYDADQVVPRPRRAAPRGGRPRTRRSAGPSAAPLAPSTR